MLESLRNLPENIRNSIYKKYGDKFPDLKVAKMNLMADGMIRVTSESGTMLFNENGEELV
jgi:hypothetical protein